MTLNHTDTAMVEINNQKMQLMFHVAITALLLAAPCRAFAVEPKPGTQTAQKLTVKSGGKETVVDYWLFLPKSYDKKKSWPLMLFLHGAGERDSNLNQVMKWGPPKRVGEKKDFPFVVISPQCPKNKRWNPAQLHSLVEHIATSYQIDRSRLYCTGLSMGGYGTWAMIAKYPKLFAAVAPICGGGDPDTAKKLTGIPIWAFHGEADRVVPPTRSSSMIEAIKKAGGTKAKLTIYPGVNHNSWSKTYANEKVYEWLLSHSSKPKKVDE
jgi:predicted peptidase